MEMGKKRIDKTSVLAALVATVWFTSLLPVLYAGFFAHPLFDDFGYSYRVHDAIQGGSVFGALLETVRHFYFRWQGTYSAVAVFALQPGVFSDSLYVLTCFLMIGSLSGAFFYLFDTVIRKWLGARRAYVVIAACAALTLCIQFVPDIFSAYYWFNGSSFYTLFFSCALVFLTMLIRTEVSAVPLSAGKFAVLLLLAVFIGGGNFTTALFAAEFLFLFICGNFFRKTGNRWKYIAIFLVYIAAFLLNALAPGNKIRADATNSMGLIAAIIYSVYYAAIYIGSWTALPQIVFFVIVAVISFLSVPNCSLSFRCPLLVIIIGFLLFASQLTPPLYAMSFLGSGRQVDIYYYSYYIYLSFSAFYLSGWLYRQFKAKSFSADFVHTVHSLLHQHAVVIAISLCALCFVGCFSNSLPRPTSIQTAKAIWDGSLKQYDLEYEKIVEQLTSGEKEVIVRDIQTVPPFLSEFDMSNDESYWVNQQIADYYHLDSVRSD